jgi:transcription initiation factor IIF auxiliary subunit
MAIKINGTTNADHIELLSKLALKAQNQCRTTIATLSEMKNPKRAMFVKQLNQANQMQVNNSKDSDSEIQKKTSNPANELLEQTDGERLDTRTTGETIGDDDAVKAVAEINRA